MLNSQQKAAVRYIEGPLLVLSGAGSGKTRVIIEKIIHLIEHCGFLAKTIVAVTFTNKAQKEMKERLNRSLAPRKRQGLKMLTFHALGLRILKQEYRAAGLNSGFTLFDSEDCLQIIKELLPPGKAAERDYLLRLQQLFSHWKNSINEHQEELNLFDLKFQKEATVLYQQYCKALRAYNGLDFDDLICLPVNLFKADPMLLRRWQNKIRYLLIDEYQDSNRSQYELVKLLVGTTTGLTVVGDDDQSIYAWRGARAENLLYLQNDFPTLRVIKLEQNYRSTATILQVANQLIMNNPHLFPKKLWCSLGPGDLLRVLVCKDEHDEAEQVINDLIACKIRSNTSFGDYAILYRSNHQSRLFEKLLVQQGIPYYLSGGQSWFSRAEIKDIIAYLKLLCNAADDASFLRAIRTPKKGIGEISLTNLGHYAKQTGKSLYESADRLGLSECLSEQARQALYAFKYQIERLKERLVLEPFPHLFRDLIEEIGYESYLYENNSEPNKAQKKMDHVWELLSWIERIMTKNPSFTLSDVVNRLLLNDILAKSDEGNGEEVQLMTLHAAKGLEFPYVYLVGVEEELLPHRNSIELTQIEEERRLMYVGITRAKKKLCLSLAKQRRRGGEWQEVLPSRFLEELPVQCLEWYGKEYKNEQRSRQIAKNHLEDLKSLLIT